MRGLESHVATSMKWGVGRLVTSIAQMTKLRPREEKGHRDLGQPTMKRHRCGLRHCLQVWALRMALGLCASDTCLPNRL